MVIESVETFTYTCDGCGWVETTTERTAWRLPADWGDISDDIRLGTRLHLCPSCYRNARQGAMRNAGRGSPVQSRSAGHRMMVLGDPSYVKPHPWTPECETSGCEDAEEVEHERRWPKDD